MGALMLALGGCSVLVMRGVAPGADGAQEPECSESHVPIYVDGFTASFLAAVAAELPTMEPPVPGSFVMGTVLASLVYTVSAVSGASKYKECRRARADWHAREAIRESGASTDIEQSAAAGYFCTSSPSRPELHPCARERGACEHVRKTLALPDGEACAPRELAWCLDIHGAPRCFGTQYACEEQGAASAAPRACTERP
jgi:hypothetical protein